MFLVRQQRVTFRFAMNSFWARRIGLATWCLLSFAAVSRAEEPEKVNI
jgi:hypothetical protein